MIFFYAGKSISSQPIYDRLKAKLFKHTAKPTIYTEEPIDPTLELDERIGHFSSRDFRMKVDFMSTSSLPPASNEILIDNFPEQNKIILVLLALGHSILVRNPYFLKYEIKTFTDIKKFIFRQYRRWLNREPDLDGFVAYFTTLFYNRLTYEDIEKEISNSQEAKDLLQRSKRQSFRNEGTEMKSSSQRSEEGDIFLTNEYHYLAEEIIQPLTEKEIVDFQEAFKHTGLKCSDWKCLNLGYYQDRLVWLTVKDIFQPCEEELISVNHKRIELEFRIYYHYINEKMKRKQEYGIYSWSQTLEKISLEPRKLILNSFEKLFVPDEKITTYSSEEAGELTRKTYKSILEREADPGGYENCVRELTSGQRSLRDVACSLIDSEEYRNLITTRMMARLLHREFKDLYPLSFSQERKKLRIKYYSWMGTSGYCMAAKMIIDSLRTCPEIEILFSPISYYFFEYGKMDETDKFMIGRYDESHQYDYDILVIHSVPFDWPGIVEEERKHHSNGFLTYGITIWETDTLPEVWLPKMEVMDMISVPSVWNYEVFEKALASTKVVLDLVYHPIEEPKEYELVSLDQESFLPLKLKDKYVFYSINEWTGRKGVEDLILAFCQEFRSDEKVALYLKTSGSVKKPAGQAYLQKIKDQYPDSPEVYLDYRILSRKEILDLHSEAQTFITLTRAEGMGYGICEAIFLDKPVISGGYGAQTEYAHHVTYLDYEMIPANFCSKEIDPVTHANCPSHLCLQNDLYDGRYQSWGKPLISETRKTMRLFFEEKRVKGEEEAKIYLRENFNFQTVGQKFYQSFQKLLSLS